MNDPGGTAEDDLLYYDLASSALRYSFLDLSVAET